MPPILQTFWARFLLFLGSKEEEGTVYKTAAGPKVETSNFRESHPNSSHDHWPEAEWEWERLRDVMGNLLCPILGRGGGQRGQKRR